MIKRTYKPSDMDVVFDSPTLSEEFSPEEWLSNRDNVCVTDGKNIAMFEYAYPGVYTGHVFCREDALAFGKAALSFVFRTEPIKVIRGATPDNHSAAKMFNRKLGFTSHGLIDTIDGPHELFILTKEEFNGQPS